VNRVDKIILSILALEHLGFGLYGLFSPEGIAELTGYGLNNEFAYSEIRAYYTLIFALGFIAFLSIFIHKLAKQTYILFTFIFSSILIGRVINYLLTGELVNTIILAMVAEVIVILLSLWRLAFFKYETKNES
tara:strand:- start:620 stop:1018 length:399 start_codon:yes stop_codon:yes gene_type:complete